MSVNDSRYQPILLNCNASMDTFPNNKAGDFTIGYTNAISHKGMWRIGLTNVVTPGYHSFRIKPFDIKLGIKVKLTPECEPIETIWTMEGDKNIM